MIHDEPAIRRLAANPRAYCIGLWNVVSDQWDFEREYSLRNPFKANPQWSANMKKSVLKGTVIKGMTPEMVAWVMGWPSIFGTKNYLRTLNHWLYDSAPPHTVDIYFENGRLVRQEWPSMP